MPVIKDLPNLAFQHYFISSHSGTCHVNVALKQTADIISDFFQESETTYVNTPRETLFKDIGNMLLNPEAPDSISNVLAEVKHNIMRHSLNISHPYAMAHLHCPPLIPAICADMIVSALNQSMDSWDQSPSATAAEQHMTEWLCGLYELPGTSAGTFTTGGTQSNYMGLLMARDDYCINTLGHEVKKRGLPQEAHRFKILCSEEAHFTVKKSAAQLGLGEEAVIPVPTNDQKRMIPSCLNEALQHMKRKSGIPIAIVGTAGTTDFGSIDPLEEIAGIAAKENIWFHVDASFGGALALSQHYSYKLHGISLADSISVDFHKLFYQPISCGAFLAKNCSSFHLLAHQADYLNPEDDKEEGMVHLVDHSVQTTRRFDALKVLVTLKTLGTHKWGEMIDQSIASAGKLAQEINIHPSLELVIEPEMNAIVFRYRLSDSLFRETHMEDDINRKIQQHLYQTGKAAIAKTRVSGTQYLKCTLLNPLTNTTHIKNVVKAITETGLQLENNEIRRNTYERKDFGG